MSDDDESVQSACVRCGKEISLIHDEPTMPNHAVILFTSGNYGSRVYDEMGSSIALYLCDDCLVACASNGWVSEVKPQPRPKSAYVRWAPTEQ